MAKLQRYYTAGSYTNTTNGVTTLREVVAEEHELQNSVSSESRRMKPYASEHQFFSGGLMTGTKGYGSFDNCPSRLYDYTASFSDPEQSDSAFTTRMLAATNPSRPDILLPTFLWELKDIPSMLRMGGRALFDLRGGMKPKDIRNKYSRYTGGLASANLALQFGWAPLLGDLVKISKFQDSVNKRRKELNDMYDKGKRSKFGSSDETEPFVPFQGSYAMWSSLGAGFSVGITRVRTVRTWGVVSWVTNSKTDLPHTDDQIRRQLLGLTAGHMVQNVWEALPWSWLVDYFTNIGGALKANNRTVGRPDDACRCVTRTVETTFDPLVQPGFSCSGGTYRRVRRSRTKLSTGLSGISFSFPTLGTRQVSVLASLAVMRAR